MNKGMAARQARMVDWGSLRTGGGTLDLPGDLITLLTMQGGEAIGAFRRLENAIVSQGDLFQCAPWVVRVLMAAVVDETIPEANLGAVLDILCRILAGYSDDSETKAGNGNLDEQCHREAIKGYWSLMKIAMGENAFGASKLAREALEMLDEGHSSEFLA